VSLSYASATVTATASTYDSVISIVAGDVLQNRLQMAHDLKLLTDSSHCMSDSELEDLRLHVKVVVVAGHQRNLAGHDF